MGARLLALSLTLAGCASVTPAPAPAPVPEGSCETAGVHLAELGCPEATTPAGTHFAEACNAAVADGRNWHPECIARVADCSQVADAFRGCP